VKQNKTTLARDEVERATPQTLKEPT